MMRVDGGGVCSEGPRKASSDWRRERVRSTLSSRFSFLFFLLNSTAVSQCFGFDEELLHMTKYRPGDRGGQRLYFIDFVFEVAKSCRTALQLLSYLQLPKLNRADSGTAKL